GLEPQEAAPALRRGAATGSPSRRAQAGAWHSGAAGLAAGPEPALVARLSARPAERRPAPPHPRGRRRLHPGVPGAGGRYISVRLRVGRELDAIIARRGKPVACVSDNGTELTSMAILRWCQETGVHWHYITPGKPQQNAFIESFNGRL